MPTSGPGNSVADMTTTVEDSPTPVVTRTRWGPVLALALGMLAVTSEMAMSSVVLPEIGRAFEVSSIATAWVLLAFALPMGAIAVPAGRWADGADTRAVFMLSMLGLTATTLLAAFAPNFELLIAARVLQGLTGGLIMSIYMTVVMSSVLPKQRGRAMSLIVLMMTLGGMSGAAVSGVVAGAFGWREVFLLKLVLLAPVLWTGWRTIPGNGRGLPLPGRTLLLETALFAGAVTVFLLSVEQIEQRVWLTVALLAAAVGLAVWWSKLSTTQPVLQLLRRRTIGLTLLSLTSISLIAGLTLFLLPYYVVEVLGRGPELVGASMLFFIGAMSLSTPLAGVLADRFGAHRIAVLGALASVASLLPILTLGSDAESWHLWWRLAAFGMAFGMFNAPMNTALLSVAPPSQSGLIGGFSATTRTIGGTVGSAIAALCWSLADGGVAGFRLGVAVLLGAVVAGTVVLLFVRGNEKTPSA